MGSSVGAMESGAEGRVEWPAQAMRVPSEGRKKRESKLTGEKHEMCVRTQGWPKKMI